MRYCDRSRVSNFPHAYQALWSKWYYLYMPSKKRWTSLIFEKWTKVKIRGEHKRQRLPKTTWRNLLKAEARPLLWMYLGDNNWWNAWIYGFWLNSDIIRSAIRVARIRHQNDRIHRQVTNNRIIPSHKFPLQENTHRVHRVYFESWTPLYQRFIDHCSKAVRTWPNRRGS